MSRVMPGNVGKEYHTGAGGKADAARAAAVLAIWLAVIVWTCPSLFVVTSLVTAPDILTAILAGGLVPLGLVVAVVYFVMAERNARVIISDDGLLIQNWRKSTKVIVWDSICRVVWQETGLLQRTYWLIPVVRNTSGRPRRKTIWMAPSSQAGEVEQLRDDIIVRCDLFESGEQAPLVLQPLMLFLGLKEIRVWRRHEVVG